MKKPTIGSVFDELQQVYTQKMIGWVPFYLKMIEGILPDFPKDQPARNLLDLGTGNGNIAVMLLEKYPSAKLHLIDASTKMLDACRERFKARSNIVYQQALMQDLQLEKGRFDLITASFSLHHMNDKEKELVIKNIWHWLRPQGIFSYADLFIDRTDPSYSSLLTYWKDFVYKKAGLEEWEELFDHHQKYDFPCSLSNTMRWLQEAGFSQISVSLRDKYWLNILAKA